MYLPQFGGCCAKAVGENNIADVNSLTYKIVNGKLWEKDIRGRIAKAVANWPGRHAAE